MAQVPHGLCLHYDDGAGRHWYLELRAPQYLRAGDIDWHGIFQTAQLREAACIIGEHEPFEGMVEKFFTSIVPLLVLRDRALVGWRFEPVSAIG